MSKEKEPKSAVAAAPGFLMEHVGGDSVPAVDLLFAGLHPSKISCVDIHPVRSWVAVGYEDGTIKIWDYERAALVRDINPQGTITERLQAIDVEDLIQKQPDFKGPKVNLNQQRDDLGKTRYGAVKFLRFVDEPSKAAFSFRRLHEEAQGMIVSPRRTTKDVPQGAKLGDPQIPFNLLIIVTETRILFYDYLTQITRELNQPEKPVSAIEPIPNSALVAFALADGNVRLFDYLRFESRQTLRSGSNKPILKLVAYELAKDASAVEDPMLMAASTDGHFYIWNLSTLAPSAGSAPAQPNSSTSSSAVNIAPSKHKIHASDITHVAVNLIDNVIIATASDKSVVMWDLRSCKDLGRMRPPAAWASSSKMALRGVEAFTHPRYAPNTTLAHLRHAEEKSKVYLMELGTEKNFELQLRVLIDTNALPSTGKISGRQKIYSIHVHALRPNLLVCVTKMGLYALLVDSHASPPNWTPAPAGMKDNKVLLCTDDRVMAMDLDSKAPPLEVFKTERGVGVSRPQLDLSATGKHLCIRQPDSYRYQIVRMHTVPLKVIEEGYAKAFAWSWTGDQYAIQVIEPQQPVKKDSNAKKEKKEKKDMLPARPPPPKQSFLVKEVKEDGSTVVVLNALATVSSARPAVLRLSTGVLLGVHYHQNPPGSASSSSTTPSPSLERVPEKNAVVSNSIFLAATSTGVAPSEKGLAALSMSTLVTGSDASSLTTVETQSHSNLTTFGNAFQFWDWKNLVPLGPTFPSPQMLSWDPKERFCVIGWRTHSFIYQLKPKFSFLCKLIAPVVSALWVNSALVYATPNTIEMVIPNENPFAPFRIASFEPTVDSRVPIQSTKPSLYPPIHFRPPGAISLVRFVDERLVVMSASGKLLSIPVVYPAFKMLLLAAAGSPKEALEWALTLNPKYHPLVGEFFLSIGAVRECIKLPGMPHKAKLDVCIANSLFEDAPDAIEPLIPLVVNAHARLARQQQGSAAAAAVVMSPSLAAAVPAAESAADALPSLAELEAAVLRFAQLATVAGNVRKAGKLYKQAVSINASNYRLLVAHMVRNGKQKKLSALAQKLSAANRHDDAKFVLLVLEDEAAFRASLEKASVVSEYAAYTAANTKGNVLSADVLSRWNSTVNGKYPDIGPLSFTN